MLHFLPDLVLADRLEAQDEPKPIPVYAIAPEPPGLVPASGVLHQAHGASAEKGAALVGFLVQEIVGVLRQEFPQLGGVLGRERAVAWTMLGSPLMAAHTSSRHPVSQPH